MPPEEPSAESLRTYLAEYSSPTKALSGADQFSEQGACRGDAVRSAAAAFSAFAASRAMRFSVFFCSRSRRLLSLLGVKAILNYLIASWWPGKNYGSPS
ncbi:MAG: hypothetical protein ACI9DF_004649 [Verrucomicrobiales bacterium]|jgi:hypothetical protein